MPYEVILGCTQPCKSIWQLHPHSSLHPNHSRQAAFQLSGETLVVLAPEVSSPAQCSGYFFFLGYISHNYLHLLQEKNTPCPLGGCAFTPERFQHGGELRHQPSPGCWRHQDRCQMSISWCEQGRVARAGPGVRSAWTRIPAWPLPSSVTLCKARLPPEPSFSHLKWSQ